MRRFFRWAARLPSNTWPLAVRLLASIGVVLSHVSGRATIFVVGLILIGVAGWGVSHEATLFLLGLFLIRDAERKPDTEQ